MTLIHPVDIHPIRPSDLAEGRLGNLAVPLQPIRLPTDLIFDGPILPRLLHAAVDGQEGIERFVDTFGWTGITDWLGDGASPAMDGQLAEMSCYFEGNAPRWDDASFANMLEAGLAVLLRDPVVLRLWKEHAAELTWICQEIADSSDLDRTFQWALNEAHLMPVVALGLEEIDGSPSVVAMPLTIWDRARLELLEVVGTRGLRPAQCQWCRSWFPPRRSGQRYCPGTDCADRRSRKRWDATEYRKVYQRMYARKRRGTISTAEFEEWKVQNEHLRTEGRKD